MKIFIGLAIILIVLIGILYIIAVNRINSTENTVRDAASNLDSMIAERYHILKRILPILKEAGVTENETLNKNILLRIGMTVSEQKLAYSLMKDMEPVLTDLMVSDPKLQNNHVLTELIDSFIKLEPQIAEAGNTYNNAVEKFNEAIASFPARLIADHKKKYPRSYFDATI